MGRMGEDCGCADATLPQKGKIYYTNLMTARLLPNSLAATNIEGIFLPSKRGED